MKHVEAQVKGGSPLTVAGMLDREEPKSCGKTSQLWMVGCPGSGALSLHLRQKIFVCGASRLGAISLNCSQCVTRVFYSGH